MSYAVTWKPAADDELAEMWTAGPDREAVARAADQAEEWFHHNPSGVGESRAGAKRILFVGPLAIDYEVLETKQTFLVLWVRRSKRTR